MIADRRTRRGSRSRMVTGSSSSSALAVGLAAVLALSAATSTAEGAHLGMVGSRRSVGPYSTLQLHARQYGADAPGQRQSTGFMADDVG